MDILQEDEFGKLGCVYPGCSVRVSRKLYDLHLLHCRKIYKGQYDFCRYSPRHLFPTPEIPLHEKVCVKRESFERIQKALQLSRSKTPPVSCPLPRQTLKKSVNRQREAPTDPAEFDCNRRSKTAELEAVQKFRKLSIVDSAIDDELSNPDSRSSALSDDYFPAPTPPSKSPIMDRKSDEIRDTSDKYMDAQEPTGFPTEDALKSTGLSAAQKSNSGPDQTNDSQPAKPVVRKGMGRGRRLRVQKDILRPGGGTFDT